MKFETARILFRAKFSLPLPLPLPSSLPKVPRFGWFELAGNSSYPSSSYLPYFC